MIIATIYDILSTAPEAKKLMDDKIFHLLVPTDTKATYALFFMTGSTPVYVKQRHPIATEYEIHIEVGSNKNSDMVQASIEVQKALECSRGKVHAGQIIKDVRLLKMEEAITEDLIAIRAMKFSIQIQPQN